VSVTNTVTIDLEDWHQVLPPAQATSGEHWDAIGPRVEASAHRALGLLRGAGARATFFVVGWVAERAPSLVRAIADEGHEVGSHSYGHAPVHTLSRAEFADDLRRSIDVLEGILGAPIRGYRAPHFSITEATPWVFEELSSVGLEYDSSVLPMRRSGNGMPFAPRHPYRVRLSGGGVIREFPIPTARILGHRICLAGGRFIRRFPERLTQAAIDRMNRSGHPAMIYFYPWELEEEPPAGRHGVGEGRRGGDLAPRNGLMAKLERILGRGNFGPVGEVLDRVLPARVFV
jgi:polysaccharide deacetylase family protein (PEP-CTERM system associated)